MKHATIDLPDATFARLESLAAQHGRTTDEVILQAIVEKLEDLEDLLAAEEVMRLRQVEGGQDISLEDLSRRLGLDS